MSYPFGGMPSLAQYLVWARDTHGIEAKTGYAQSSRGKTVSVIRLATKDGKSAIVSGVAQSEKLVASMVGHLDRRLGVNSPWFAV
jgi:hypothetical protein